MSRLVLSFNGGSLLIRPGNAAQTIADAFEDDPESAKAEWGAEFRSDVGEYLSNATINAAIAKDRKHLDPQPGVIYSAFLDVAGGAGGDAIALAIAHAERDEEGNARYVQDLLVYHWPEFNAATVIKEFSGILARYGVSHVTGDDWGKGLVSADFALHGITYEGTPHTTSEMYGQAAKLFVERRIELLDLAPLIIQLRQLVRRPRAGFTDKISHGTGSHDHDDLINAACGALLLVAERELQDPVIDEQIAIEATQRAEPDVRFRPRILAAIVQAGRCIVARRVGLQALEPMTFSGSASEIGGRIAALAVNWSAFAIYLADTEPGAPTAEFLRSLNVDVLEVDLFAQRDTNYKDARAQLAFGLRDWLQGGATVPQCLLHDLVALSFVAKRGVYEVLDATLTAADALAIAAADQSPYQDPRTITQASNISRCLVDDGRWGGAPPASHQQRRGVMEPYHLGGREPDLARDGWARTLPAQDVDRSIHDYDPLSR